MSNADKLELDGVVTQVNKGTNFDVTLKDNGAVVNCTISGRLRQNRIRILQGDKVSVLISPYDLTKGIINWRYKD